MSSKGLSSGKKYFALKFFVSVKQNLLVLHEHNGDIKSVLAKRLEDKIALQIFEKQLKKFTEIR
jgi:hypothetical protein